MSLNFEALRLRTFDIWPQGTYLIDAQQCARNGFYAVNEVEAECNWCHQRIDARDCVPPVELRHRILQPTCTFILDASGSGNVALPPFQTDSVGNSTTESSTGIGTGTGQTNDLFIEANRLATYKNWPNPNISPESLAKAGFFYLNRSDEVKCVWCKGVIAKWEQQDDAFEEHKRFFPDCPRVQLGPLIEMTSDGIRELGIQQITTPKKPKFSSLDARMRTYTNWPIHDIQRPEALAQAGLYYQNVDDQVRCFHCSIGLRSWQKEDDPWFEHAKWYPQCQFVRLVKGANYVRHVQEATRQLHQSSSQRSSPMSIDEAMTTPAVMQALEIGIDGGALRNATQRQLHCTGQPYSNVEDLLKAVFAERHEQEQDREPEVDADQDPDSDTAPSNIMREVSRLMNSIFNSTVEGQRQTTLLTTPVESVQMIRTPTASTSTASSIASTINPIPTTPTTSTGSNDQAATSNSTLQVDAISTSNNNNNHKRPVDSSNETKAATTTTTTTWCDMAPPERSLSLEEENRKLKDARLCKVCLDEEVGVVFLPCGHLVTCVQCASGVGLCPMCRTGIKGFVRTYLS